MGEEEIQLLRQEVESLRRRLRRAESKDIPYYMKAGLH